MGIKWTLEKCQESAKNFNSLKAWRKGDPGACAAAIRNDWLEQCCSHMDQRV